MELIIILWTIATEQKVRTASDKIPPSPPQKKNQIKYIVLRQTGSLWCRYYCKAAHYMMAQTIIWYVLYKV